jgi:uncharacterized protein
MPSDYSRLQKAVLQRHTIKCLWKGLERQFCPYALGMKDGRAHIIVWQNGGKSWNPLRAQGDWRCVPIAQITDLQRDERAWQCDSAPPPPHMALDLVDVIAPHIASAA